MDVEEKVNAAAGPRLPRRYASNGIASSNKSNHGRANVSALCAGHQSNNPVMSSESRLPRRSPANAARRLGGISYCWQIGRRVEEGLRFLQTFVKATAWQ